MQSNSQRSELCEVSLWYSIKLMSDWHWIYGLSAYCISADNAPKFPFATLMQGTASLVVPELLALIEANHTCNYPVIPKGMRPNITTACLELIPSLKSNRLSIIFVALTNRKSMGRSVPVEC